jgi:uncharacterized protein YdeI (YjbR/CyaY-like superfamily)
MTARPREAMPRAIASALTGARLRAAYVRRPPYQRNDYLRWIRDAKRDTTRRKRIEQMLAELRQGDVYMKMKWSA